MRAGDRGTGGWALAGVLALMTAAWMVAARCGSDAWLAGSAVG